MARRFAFCPVLLLSLLATSDFVAAADCTRDELKAADDAFLKTAVDKEPLAYAETLKVSENMVMLDSLDQTSLTRITGRLKPDFHMQAIDTAQCEVTSMILVNEGEKVPTREDPADTTILSYRIKLSGPDGYPSEIELLNTNMDSRPTYFEPFSLPERTPTIWKTSTPGKTRDDILKIVTSYTDGIEKACSECVKSTKDCRRVENGWMIPPVCNAQFEYMGFPVYGKRWTVDVDTGVAVGEYFFGAPGTGGLFTHEFFSTADGQIRQVSANWIGAKTGQEDVWSGEGPPADWKRPANAKDRPASEMPKGPVGASPGPAPPGPAPPKGGAAGSSNPTTGAKGIPQTEMPKGPGGASTGPAPPKEGTAGSSNPTTGAKGVPQAEMPKGPVGPSAGPAPPKEGAAGSSSPTSDAKGIPQTEMPKGPGGASTGPAPPKEGTAGSSNPTTGAKGVPQAEMPKGPGGASAGTAPPKEGTAGSSNPTSGTEMPKGPGGASAGPAPPKEGVAGSSNPTTGAGGIPQTEMPKGPAGASAGPAPPKEGAPGSSNPTTGAQGIPQALTGASAGAAPPKGGAAGSSNTASSTVTARSPGRRNGTISRRHGAPARRNDTLLRRANETLVRRADNDTSLTSRSLFTQVGGLMKRQGVTSAPTNSSSGSAGGTLAARGLDALAGLLQRRTVESRSLYARQNATTASARGLVPRNATVQAANGTVAKRFVS